MRTPSAAEEHPGWGVRWLLLLTLNGTSASFVLGVEVFGVQEYCRISQTKYAAEHCKSFVFSQYFSEVSSKLNL